MKKKSNDQTEVQKLATLSFDEVCISNKIDFDRGEQKIYGPFKTCQCVIARGLMKNWKQPIYYDFNQNMTKNILLNIIRHLKDAGFTIVAVVSDMGSGNNALWKPLNVGIPKNNSKDED